MKVISNEEISLVSAGESLAIIIGVGAISAIGLFGSASLLILTGYLITHMKAFTKEEEEFFVLQYMNKLLNS